MNRVLLQTQECGPEGPGFRRRNQPGPSIFDSFDYRQEMEQSKNSEQPDISSDRRSETRSTRLRNYRIEIKFVGEPVYQFRVREISSNGAGILVKDDSGFLDLIEVGQVMQVNFISPRGSKPAGFYKAEIKHISRLDQGRYKGHRLIGISILEKLESQRDFR